MMNIQDNGTNTIEYKLVKFITVTLRALKKLRICVYKLKCQCLKKYSIHRFTRNIHGWKSNYVNSLFEIRNKHSC